MNKKTGAGRARLCAVVEGIVQGVNFRYYTQRQAETLGVTGWVANCRDGTVQVVAEGARPALEALVAWLQHGPPSAQVDCVRVIWADATGEFESFRIKYF